MRKLPADSRTWWSDLGFGEAPQHRTAPREGVLVYRAWGGASREWGSGFFSLEKPASVIDAELRFNIADWGNTIHFVSTFQIPAGVPFMWGSVAHGSRDLSSTGTQVWLGRQNLANLRLVKSAELLRHDGYVLAQPQGRRRVWN
jgi:hypothetical protein